MSRLILVRHGQASFLEENYDKLSAKGEEQARLLGEYWAQHKIHFDQVFTGPRVRQRETARIAGEAYRATGLPFPDITVQGEFDEFQAEAVMNQCLPPLLETHDRVRELHRTLADSQTREEKIKNFQPLFEAVIGQWIHGEITAAEIEPWGDFCARVRRGLVQLSNHGSRGKQIAIFTSGGPVGVAMQHALGLAPLTTFKTGGMVRNGAYSEFLISSDRFTLSVYNAHPHLTDLSLLTYR